MAACPLRASRDGSPYWYARAIISLPDVLVFSGPESAGYPCRAPFGVCVVVLFPPKLRYLSPLITFPEDEWALFSRSRPSFSRALDIESIRADF